MAEENMNTIDIDKVLEGLFNDDSIATEQPEFVLFLGGVASGKTTMRKQQYPNGYVVLDASDIFLNLSQGRILPFGEVFKELLDFIGVMIAARAIRERRNLVTEMLGDALGSTKEVINSMKSQGYKVKIVAVDCDVEEAQRRNANRTDDSISAYYTQNYHALWIVEAVKKESEPFRE